MGGRGRAGGMVKVFELGREEGAGVPIAGVGGGAGG